MDNFKKRAGDTEQMEPWVTTSEREDREEGERKGRRNYHAGQLNPSCGLS